MVSAVLRLKNEAEWLDRCIQSIDSIFDEIVLCTQGEQSDNTIDICEKWQSVNSAKYRHFHYEFDSRTNGPGHADQPMDKFNRAYFYRWCFDKARGAWMCKWDGDMIATSDCKLAFAYAISQGCALNFKGIELAGDIYHTSDRPYCASETRLFKQCAFETGLNSEKFVLIEPSKVFIFPEPLFFHTKWLKSEESYSVAWPNNWRDIPHFQKILKRSRPTRTHGYPIPQCMQ